jgi:hypothetical protein
VAAIVLISCDTEATEYDELSKTGRPCGGVAISHSYVRSPFLSRLRPDYVIDYSICVQELNSRLSSRKL